jgi:mRNA interferase MazF
VIRRGEIYLVNFSPARGHEQAGTRPALVIQNDIGNEFAATTIVAAMSMRAVALYESRVTVSARESGLSESSTVLLDQLLTVDMSRLGQRIGRLNTSAMGEVDRAIQYSLGVILI